ncbi:MAG: sulfatase, partial [Verrucomicrobiota bacterium]
MISFPNPRGRNTVFWANHLSIAVWCLLLSTASLFGEKKPNILFLAIDDLRPELGCYGSTLAKTPHIDRLASEGRLFERAYCQQAICHPSRSSLLSGTRPNTNGITHNYVSFRDLNPDMVTLPQYFSENGYDTVSYGKIFHGRNDEPQAWNQKQLYQKLEFPRPGPFALEENRKQKQEQYERMVAKYGESGKRGLSSGPAYESADVPDHAYKDGYNTEAALLHLEAFAADDQEKPFFLALGFSLPHLNWTAPQTYWNLYDREALPLATQVDPPREGAATGLHASFELRVRALIPKKGPMGDDLSRTLLHAYLACTSYVDTLVGKALTALDDLGLREDTIIVLWGDHGWHLGEMGVWGKATNYEIGTRVPFIISTPGMEKPGHSTDRIVELLDIFPTLCQLSGFPMPNHLEGESLLPLLQDPSASWDKAALSQFPNPALREWAANPLSPAMRETFFGPLIS